MPPSIVKRPGETMFITRPFEAPISSIGSQSKPCARSLAGFSRGVDVEERGGISRFGCYPVLRGRQNSTQPRRQRADVRLKRIDIKLGRDGTVLFDDRGEMVTMSGRYLPLVIGLDDTFQKRVIDGTADARETCSLPRPDKRGLIGTGDRASFLAPHPGWRRSLGPR